jgi:hypothetical protein
MDPITLGIAGLSAGIGAYMSARENKKQRQYLDKMSSDNRNRYYENTYLNDIMKNAPLRRIQEQTDKMNSGINNSAVSGGLTNENKLAQMEQAGNVYAGALNDLTAQQAQRQMALKQRYEDKEDQINDARSQMSAQRGQMLAQLGGNLAGSIMDYSAMSEAFKNKKAASGGNVISDSGEASGGNVIPDSGGVTTQDSINHINKNYNLNGDKKSETQLLLDKYNVDGTHKTKL